MNSEIFTKLILKALNFYFKNSFWSHMLKRSHPCLNGIAECLSGNICGYDANNTIPTPNEQGIPCTYRHQITHADSVSYYCFFYYCFTRFAGWGYYTEFNHISIIVTPASRAGVTTQNLIVFLLLFLLLLFHPLRGLVDVQQL